MSRDWLDKDFYATLGVSKEASTEEIKKAYKKLARENHPDLNPGDTEAEKKFKEISEASSVLGDERKRHKCSIKKKTRKKKREKAKKVKNKGRLRIRKNKKRT